MGLDISIDTYVKKNGELEQIEVLDNCFTRSYWLFSLLANVRNNYDIRPIKLNDSSWYDEEFNKWEKEYKTKHRIDELSSFSMEYSPYFNEYGFTQYSLKELDAFYIENKDKPVKLRNGSDFIYEKELIKYSIFGWFFDKELNPAYSYCSKNNIGLDDFILRMYFS